jgi:hypothetical protein
MGKSISSLAQALAIKHSQKAQLSQTQFIWFVGPDIFFQF